MRDETTKQAHLLVSKEEREVQLMSEIIDHQEQTGMVTLVHSIQAPLVTSVAALAPVIDPSVAASVPGHRCIHGHYVAPAQAEVQLPSEQDFTIGRRRASSSLYLEYPDVSRSHAIIRYTQGTFTLTDLGSLNKTFLNGQEVVPQRAQMLCSGDQVRFGQYGIYLFLVPEKTS